MIERRAGIDTGGTFTDAVVRDGAGGWRIHKRPTTARRPAEAVLAALEAVQPPSGGAVELVHGTTHATNALLTGRLGRTVLVTTLGFGDVLAIGRQDRSAVYQLEPRPPRPPQPRDRVVEVAERLDAQGEVVTALDDAEVARVVAAVRDREPEAVAVAFLHAYRSARHEERIGRALEEELGVPIRLSSRVAPEQREYERFTTTWADAALLPVVAPALGELDAELRSGWGGPSRLRVMRSDGGTASAAAAAESPVHLSLSGPAGGLAAALALSEERGDRSILTLDMGGTSTDVALLDPGVLPLEPMEIGGLPLLARGLPLHSVGTGGGSLARWDRGGALAVGPASAGANPGPACYGRGGEQATVTDAHLVCGRLHPEHFLGGGFELDPDAADAALDCLARGGGVSRGEAARAVLEIASADMERALRRVSLAEGRDPRALTLYAFGGAGGLHAAWMADRLGMEAVVIPPQAGAFSAIGLLTAPPRRTLARTVLEELPGEDRRAELWAPLEEEARAELHAEGVEAEAVRLARVCELRGAGQAGILALPEGPGLAARFHEAHRQRFGYAREEEPVLLVNLRVQADGPPSPEWPRRPVEVHEAEPVDHARVVFPEDGVERRAPFYRRESFRPGARLDGPAVVAEYSGTTVVPAAWSGRIDALGALCLERRGQEEVP